MQLISLHVGLAILLFFGMNWIGRHSLSAGYIQMSVLVKSDEAPAFNFLYRAFAPIVYITLCAAVLYKAEADWAVKDIHLVVVYYFAFRLLFNIATGRSRLLNWGIQLAYWATSIPVAFYVYENLIQKNQYFFPTNEDLGNALWLGVLAFIYQTFNRVKLSNENTKKRKRNYVAHRYNHYRSIFGEAIEEVTADKRQQCLIYTILLYEAFNRPKLYRWIENVLFRAGLAKTLGVMQVTTDRLISDEESVRLGAKKIVDDHLRAQIIIKEKKPYYGSRSYWSIRSEVIALYNKDNDYVREVNGLYEVMVELFYPECKDDWRAELEEPIEKNITNESCEESA